MCGSDPLSSESDGDAADFLDRPTDQWRRGYALVFAVVRRFVFFGGGGLARWRITAIMAKASITRETWRCHPCHGLKTVLDRPPMAFDRHQRFDGCSRWTPGGEEGEIAIGDMTTDQQTARPQSLICAVEFFALEIGQFEITPIMQPRSL